MGGVTSNSVYRNQQTMPHTIWPCPVPARQGLVQSASGLFHRRCDWLQVASSHIIVYTHNIMLEGCKTYASPVGLLASFTAVVIAFSYKLYLASFNFCSSCELVIWVLHIYRVFQKKAQSLACN